ncbi:MAG: hypothetical protein ABR586_03535 [Thermoplasmatota archaeon]
MLIAASVAHASPSDPPGLPPAEFTATYDAQNGTVHLSWTAPGTGAYNYTLYRDGDILATLSGTAYNDLPPTGPVLYRVTATVNHDESPPASLILLGDVWGSCLPAFVVVGTSWPFVSAGLNLECLPLMDVAGPSHTLHMLGPR